MTATCQSGPLNRRSLNHLSQLVGLLLSWYQPAVARLRQHVQQSGTVGRRTNPVYPEDVLIGAQDPLRILPVILLILRGGRDERPFLLQDFQQFLAFGVELYNLELLDDSAANLVRGEDFVCVLQVSGVRSKSSIRWLLTRAYLDAKNRAHLVLEGMLFNLIVIQRFYRIQQMLVELGFAGVGDAENGVRGYGGYRGPRVWSTSLGVLSSDFCAEILELRQSRSQHLLHPG